MNKYSYCYICKKNPVEFAFKKLGWKVLRCRHCGLYMLYFKGSYQKFIKEYYNKDFFTGSHKRAGYCNYEGDNKTEVKNMNNYLNGIRKFKKTGELLDVGCATGLFMQEAEKRGFNTRGIDVSDYAVKIAKRRFGDKVRRSSIEKVKFNRTYDIITMFDVLEHLCDPRKVLIKLKKALKKGGILVINTGDADSFLAKLQGEHWHFFIPPQHFFYFSLTNLKKLIKQAGFDVKEVERRGKWITLRYLFHLARQIQDDIIGHLGFALVGNNFIGRVPIYLNLFDNITLYATKRNDRKRDRTEEK